jgi:hypothetical protein
MSDAQRPYRDAVATLPPDLDRLGQQLAGAAGSTLAARRRRAERRRRVAGAAVVGALAFAALTPGPLGTGVHDLDRANLVGAGVEPIGCEDAHGRSFRLPTCEGPMILRRPYAWR